jgi:hypothetical protein
MLQDISVIIYYYSSASLQIESISNMKKGFVVLGSQHQFLQEIMEYQDVLDEKDEDYLQVKIVFIISSFCITSYSS